MGVFREGFLGVEIGKVVWVLGCVHRRVIPRYLYARSAREQEQAGYVRAWPMAPTPLVRVGSRESGAMDDAAWQRHFIILFDDAKSADGSSRF